MQLTKKQQEQMRAAGVVVPEDGQTISVPGDDISDFEPISGTNLGEQMLTEAFMQEPVKIRVAQTTDKMAPPFAVVTCVGQGFTSRLRVPRGVAVYVKRCHVEILARMRETSYSQPPMNLSDPESANYLIPQHALTYPFEVLEDNELGREWLRRIYEEPSW